ncbi:MAG: endonuclease MutS2 [Pelovirga sp.]
MTTDPTLLERLGFFQLRTWLAGQTQSQPGKLLAQQMGLLANRAAVEQALTEVDEARALLQEEQCPPVGGCHDLTPVLADCQAPGALVPAAELRPVLLSLQATEGCRIWFKGRAGQLSLADLAVGIVSLPELQRRLRDAIGERGELLDSASPKLAELRYESRQMRGRIKQQLDRLLADERLAPCFQERLVTVRNGRYVVPLKSDCRGQLKGFVQDESASGQTLYLEPAQVLDSNNQLQQLLRDELREERRILLELTDLLRRDRAVLLNNQQLLAQIDMRFAAARLSRAYHGSRPELVDTPLVELRQVRHPLLMIRAGEPDLNKAVPIDLLIPEEAQVLVISGPNTGGKSVALKTLGLMLLMLRAGLHLPCGTDSRVHLYQHLFVDIGDEQSISDNLSTFSGHLVRLRRILEEADSDTLVLLDEAGSGTDPAEGAALIQAVVDELCIRGAKILLTTHLGQLKQFAHVRDGMINAAVEFDPDTLEPTYGLHYGVPGVSSALTAARRLDLPLRVVERAQDYLGNQHDQNQILIELGRQRQQLNKELDAARKLKLKAGASRELRKRQLQALKDSKKQILNRAGRQAEELISATEERLRQLRKQRPGPVAPVQANHERAELAAARKPLAAFQSRPRRNTAIPQQLEAGELVRIVALGIEARVERINNDQVDLQIGTKRMRQPLEALEQFSPRRFAEQRKVAGTVTGPGGAEQMSPRLKLVGERVEDALVRLERHLDDALLAHLSQVEIIHGAGEGILRRAVRDYLAKTPSVTAFYAAPIDQGGNNVTVVELASR